MERTRPVVEPFEVAVFAKAPVAGGVKTRLVPPLAADEAAALHQWLVRRALRTALRSGARAVSLWCAPSCAHPFFSACERDFGVTLHDQSGPGLGERMASAFAALIRDVPVLLIGSDCPALTETDLQDAAVALATHAVVLQPAEDGGYVLVGQRRYHPEMFTGIDWGDASVMHATRQRLSESGIAWLEMPVLWDVDRPEDYHRLRMLGWYPQDAA